MNRKPKEIPNAVTSKAITDAEKGQDSVGPFDSVAEVIESLQEK